MALPRMERKVMEMTPMEFIKQLLAAGASTREIATRARANIFDSSVVKELSRQSVTLVENLLDMNGVPRRFS